MDWINKEQVKKAALESEEAARAMCKKHWQQLYEATEDELRDACNNWETTLGPDFCAYCKRYCCEGCPLKDPEDTGICCKEFREARDTFHLWNYNKPGGGHSAFVEAAKLMYERI